MAQTYIFSAFTGKSIEANPDGSPRAVIVTGKVTGDQLDLDKQIIDSDWARGALAEWHQRAANVREMHRPSAVGKGLELEERDGGFWLKARITDRDAMQKCLDGVYTGFSVGIKDAKVVPDPQAPRGRIRGGVIAEISTVDAPCLPSATFGDVMPLWKMAGADGDEGIDAGEQAAEGDGIVKTAIELPADGTEATTTLTGVSLMADGSLAIETATKAAIPAKEGEPQSPPKGYPQDKGEYGDPENYSWPLDKPARVRSAMAYYNGGKGKAKYSADEWVTLGRRIVAKAKDDFGGNYTLHDGQIVRADEADKALDRDILDGEVPVLVKGLNTPVLPNARWADVDGSRVPVYADTAYDPFPQPDPVVADKATPSANVAKTIADFTPPSEESVAAFVEAVADLTKTAAAIVPDPATIEKNGVATGPTGMDARRQVYQLLLAEVTEDGGAGCCIYDIQNILGVYMALCNYIATEQYQVEAATVAGGMGKALVAAEQWDTLLDAVLRLRPQDAAALDAARFPQADATKTLAADDQLADLTKQVETLIAERDDLQKQLDFSPAPGGPLRFAPPRTTPPKDEDSESQRLQQRRLGLVGELGRTQDWTMKQAIADEIRELDRRLA